MAIELSELKTKSGHPVLRANFVKEVTVADAEGYHAKLVPGAKYDGWGHLVVGNITGVSSEVRKVLSSQKTDARNPVPVALILTSALARMAAALTMRLTDNSNSDSFKSEEEGLAWLDGRMAEFLRKR
ncbi:MAG: hypothetical protein Q8L48_03800 [Archangium sp.]|nr:hypothetical protein [Archangium sp.]